ncbi:hypothetical protein BDB00DRAFT_930163 [Zychaea mexicana]|uniref:uncharacterized protein n=1 Tax=Zychaea mexicana TaxID=64656 RepID=UPI0022FDC9CE|nr:uncharacterized protein BDB00DRAFT_930163 [Zychaea mexicana]KAI9491741.1 hypothetical protein BDB00DRAFT_930163 [Zychaea mexicana]
MLVDRAADKGVRKIFISAQNNYSAIGFTMPLFDVICGSQQLAEEYHVDSTYKTNRAGYELFGIVATVNGVGFPIAYMLLKLTPQSQLVNDGEDDTFRVGVIAEFFKCLKQAGLQPKFMFTDKDWGQICAILEAVWTNGRVLRLCLWHLVHSVKKRLADPETARPQNIPDEARDMMRKHYNWHPLIALEGGDGMLLNGGLDGPEAASPKLQTFDQSLSPRQSLSPKPVCSTRARFYPNGSVELPDVILPPPSHPPSASVPAPTTTSPVPAMQSTVSPSPLVLSSSDSEDEPLLNPRRLRQPQQQQQSQPQPQLPDEDDDD